jgi:hypothetical protein
VHASCVTGVTDKPVVLHYSELWRGLQMGAYEHNFGFWDIDGPEERAFFQYIQRQSVIIACVRCGHLVQLIPAKTVCASCVAALECGAPASMGEYGESPKTLLDPSNPPGRSLLR